MEVGFEDRVQDCPEGFLHDAVAQRWDAERSRLAVALRDVDSSDGLGLVRLPLQAVHEVSKLVLVALVVASCRQRRSSAGRQDCFGGVEIQ